MSNYSNFQILRNEMKFNNIDLTKKLLSKYITDKTTSHKSIFPNNNKLMNLESKITNKISSNKEIIKAKELQKLSNQKLPQQLQQQQLRPTSLHQPQLNRFRSKIGINKIQSKINFQNISNQIYYQKKEEIMKRPQTVNISFSPSKLKQINERSYKKPTLKSTNEQQMVKDKTKSNRKSWLRRAKSDSEIIKKRKSKKIAISKFRLNDDDDKNNGSVYKNRLQRTKTDENLIQFCDDNNNYNLIKENINKTYRKYDMTKVISKSNNNWNNKTTVAGNTTNNNNNNNNNNVFVKSSPQSVSFLSQAFNNSPNKIAQQQNHQMRFIGLKLKSCNAYSPY